jgi:radical SAM protein with 4Fe4S-binding SPASM domain
MCNLWSDYQNSAENELSLDEWRRVIDDLAGLGAERVTLIGAEPLVRRDVLEIARHIKARGMRCLIITNGTLLTAEQAREMVEIGVDRVSFSIDAPGELHDGIRGVPGSFRRATAGISALLQARALCSGHSPEVNIHTTISSSNVRVLTQLTRLVSQLGADSGSFQYLVQVPKHVVQSTVLDGEPVSSLRFSPCDEQSFLLSREGIHILREQIAEIKQHSGSQLALQLLHNFPDAYLLEGRNPIERCYQIRTKVVVDPFGNVVPCAFLEDYRIGNVRRDGLRRLWTSERYARLRKAVSARLLPVCHYCCHFNYNVTFAQAIRAYLNLGLS